VEYRIVVAESAAKLSNEVNPLIFQGWQLQGGVSIAVDANARLQFAQALTRVVQR